MTVIHCTYPDGETSEMRVGMPLSLALDLYSPCWDEGVPPATVHRHFTTVEAAIDCLATQ